MIRDLPSDDNIAFSKLHDWDNQALCIRQMRACGGRFLGDLRVWAHPAETQPEGFRRVGTAFLTTELDTTEDRTLERLAERACPKHEIKRPARRSFR